MVRYRVEESRVSTCVEVRSAEYRVQDSFSLMMIYICVCLLLVCLLIYQGPVGESGLCNVCCLLFYKVKNGTDRLNIILNPN